MLTINHDATGTRDENGRFARQYTLTYDKTRDDGETVTVKRVLSARGIETVGPVVNRKGDRGEVWNIRVVDGAGVDVTQEFGCFRD